MLWVGLDVLLVVAALSFLGAIGLKLWRQVKLLGREVGRAGEAIGRATAELEQLQSAPPELFPHGPAGSS